MNNKMVAENSKMYKYGIDFKDENGVVIKEVTFNSESERDNFSLQLQEDDNLWPDNAARATEWSREMSYQLVAKVQPHVHNKRAEKVVYEWGWV